MKLITGDCLQVMPTLPENSVDSIITDPPYCLTSITKRFGRSIEENEHYANDTVRVNPFARMSKGGFMGKEWDNDIAFRVAVWQAALRVAKPGAILMAFGGTRTFHRLACAIEDAGWELRDTMMWLYGSGFPKSLDISKAIDKEAGVYVEGVETENSRHGIEGDENGYNHSKVARASNPQSDAARLWSGYGTALKPAWEPIIIAMKPLEGTYAENAQKWGVAGLNIDGARIEGPKGSGVWGSSNKTCQDGRTFNGSPDGEEYRSQQNPQGRWPANLLLEQNYIPLLTLIDTCDIMVAEVICQYYDNYKVPAMWQRVPDISEQSGEGKEVLLKRLLRPMAEGEPTETNGGQASLGSVQREDAARTTACRPEGEGLSVLQGALDKSGLLVCQSVRTDGGTEETCRTDVSETPNGDIGTSAGNGDGSGTPAGEDRYCASQERSQDGQQNREPRADEQSRTCSAVPRIDSGKQTLEVLAGDVPEAWLRYFRPTGCSVVDPTSSARLLDEQSGVSKSTGIINRWKDGAKPFGGGAGHPYESVQGVADSGGASRFFYTAKASSSERNEGLEDRNGHPTIKPIDLMRYLCKLTRTPTGGVVLDPFMGSGTTGIACILEHRDFIGIELNAEYAEIAKKRIADMEGPLFQGGTGEVP